MAVVCSTAFTLSAQTAAEEGSRNRGIDTVEIPLPMVSFGGSSLVLTMFACGVLAAIARRQPAAAEYLAAHARPQVARRMRLRRK